LGFFQQHQGQLLLSLSIWSLLVVLEAVEVAVVEAQEVIAHLSLENLLVVAVAQKHL
jgi:hypothetical protein